MYQNIITDAYFEPVETTDNSEPAQLPIVVEVLLHGEHIPPRQESLEDEPTGNTPTRQIAQEAYTGSSVVTVFADIALTGNKTTVTRNATRQEQTKKTEQRKDSTHKIKLVSLKQVTELKDQKRELPKFWSLN